MGDADEDVIEEEEDDEEEEDLCPNDNVSDEYEGSCCCEDEAHSVRSVSQGEAAIACGTSEIRYGRQRRCARPAQLYYDGHTRYEICAFHRNMERTHRCCARCGSYVEWGAYLECTTGHVSHENCAKAESGMGRRDRKTKMPKRCSHCGSTTLLHKHKERPDLPAPVVESEAAAFGKLTASTSPAPSSTAALCDAFPGMLRWRRAAPKDSQRILRDVAAALLLRLTPPSCSSASQASLGDVVERLLGVAFELRSVISQERCTRGGKGRLAFPEDALLLQAVSCAHAGAVRALRDGGAPLAPGILASIPPNQSLSVYSDLFDALQMDHVSWAQQLLMRGNEEQDEDAAPTRSPLEKLAAARNWTLLDKLLEHFKGNIYIPPEIKAGLSFDTAPLTVKAWIRKASSVEQEERMRRTTRHVVLQDLSEGRERFPIRVVNDVDDARIGNFAYTSRVIDTEGILERRKRKVSMYCDCAGSCEAGTCGCWSGAYESTDYSSSSSDSSQSSSASSSRSASSVAVPSASSPTYCMEGEGIDGRRLEDSLAAWKHRKIRTDMLAYPVPECSSACACSLHCGNRVAQKGASYPVEVFRSSDGRGWGVRALCAIPRGAFLAEYTGELIGDEEAARREDKYLFETAIGAEKFNIDANFIGNVTRFINHSCAPNAKVGLVSWEPYEELFSHICVFAARQIARGEEITIHYGHSWWTANLREFSCLCKTNKCSYNEDARSDYIHYNVSPRNPRDEDPDEIPP